MHHHGDDPLTSVIVCNHGLHRSHGVALATQEILNHLTDPNDCGRMFNVQLFQISKAGHYKKDIGMLNEVTRQALRWSEAPWNLVVNPVEAWGKLASTQYVNTTTTFSRLETFVEKLEESINSLWLTLSFDDYAERCKNREEGEEVEVFIESNDQNRFLFQENDDASHLCDHDDLGVDAGVEDEVDDSVQFVSETPASKGMPARAKALLAKEGRSMWSNPQSPPPPPERPNSVSEPTHTHSWFPPAPPIAPAEPQTDSVVAESTEPKQGWYAHGWQDWSQGPEDDHRGKRSWTDDSDGADDSWKRGRTDDYKWPGDDYQWKRGDANKSWGAHDDYKSKEPWTDHQDSSQSHSHAQLTAHGSQCFICHGTGMMSDDLPAQASVEHGLDTVKATMTCLYLDDRARMDVQNYLFANTKTGYGEVMQILKEAGLNHKIVKKSAYVTAKLRDARQEKSSSSSARRT